MVKPLLLASYLAVLHARTMAANCSCAARPIPGPLQRPHQGRVRTGACCGLCRAGVRSARGRVERGGARWHQVPTRCTCARASPRLCAQHHVLTAQPPSNHPQVDNHLGALTVEETLSFAYTCQEGMAAPPFDAHGRMLEAKVRRRLASVDANLLLHARPTQALNATHFQCKSLPS